MPRTAELPAHVHVRDRLVASADSPPRSSSRRAAARLPGRRARPGRRRHLARQHLPRRRLRRPLAALLLLVRAEPALDPVLLPAAGDPGLHPRRRRARRGARPVPARDLVQEAAGTTTRSCGGACVARRAHRRPAGLRRRRAVRPDAGHRRHRLGGQPGLPLGAVARGRRPRSGKRVAVIGTGIRDPDRPGDRRGGGAPHGVPAHRAVRRPAPGPRVHEAERLAFKHLPAVQRIYRTGVYWSREALVPGFVSSRSWRSRSRKAALANSTPRPAHQARAAREGQPTSGSAASGS